MDALPTGTVTFLFSDIEGSTRLLQELGDEFRPVLERHLEILRAALAETGGVEVSVEGDGFFAAFTTAPAAVACAAAMQRGLSSEAWPGRIEVRVRIGLHTGIGRLGGTNYVGIDVHRAARIMSSGHGLQTVLSSATAALVEWDLPPGTALQDLGRHELKDLAHPERLFQLVLDGLPAVFPPLRTVVSSKTNLPTRDTAFIGRAAETDEIGAAIRAHRLVTLTGAAGVGKTSLAMHAAGRVLADFRDGVWMVEIVRVQDPALIGAAVAKQLQITEAATQPIEETLASRLMHASMLLVLDGCEHLVAEVARFASALLRATSGVRILVTSREPLAIRSEHIIRVAPLAVPPAGVAEPARLQAFDAVALFADRAAQVLPSFRIDAGTAAAVAEVSRRLDGIPLAIELAAARLKLLSVRQLAHRLEREFAVLTSGRRDALPHHQTLQATLDWSYELLAPVEQLLFARLSVFSGSFSLEAAEEVCAGEALPREDLLDVLGRLVDTSLAQATSSDPVRYRLLEPIAQYARARLEQTGGGEETRDRHAAFFLRLAEEADAELLGRDQMTWAERLSQDRYNLLGALAWLHGSGKDRDAVRLAGAIQWFWVIRREVTEGTEWLGRVLAHRGDAPPEAVVRALNGAGLLAQRRLDFEHARALFREGLDMCGRSDDPTCVARQTYYLAVTAWFQDDPDEADRLAAEAQRLVDPVADPWTLAWTLAVRGTIARSRGDLDMAGRYLDESHALFLRMGGALDRGWSHLRAAALERDRGRYSRAAADYEAGRLLLEQARDIIGLAHADAGRGAMAWLRGDHELALALFRSALDGFAKTEVATDSLFELKTMIQGNPTIAELQQVARWNKERAAMPGELGTQAALGEYLYHLGRTAQRRGELDRAGTAVTESLGLCLRAGDLRGVAIALIRLGQIDRESGRPERAAVLFGAADEVARRDHLAPWPPADEPDYPEHRAALERHLGTTALDAALREGAATSVGDLVALLRGSPGQATEAAPAG
jgi:predicted ATPase/class 3 adenylate cyclase